TKVHPDLFNLPKSVVDALQGIAYHNDRQIKEGHIIVTEAWERDSFSVHITKI
ncbi:RusA family crossover junction endodeoxyribonuclease, partial [Patescibacteria group bacterium]|nr:RusA family crossover junction endodeoxyribonuclease [Patescibacteria group bacterium]